MSSRQRKRARGETFYMVSPHPFYRPEPCSELAAHGIRRIYDRICRGRCHHAVRRSLLHSVSAGAAKTPYPQSPSSSPKGNRFTGLPFDFYIPALADRLPLHKGAFGRTELSAPTNCIRKMLRPDRIRPGGAGAGGLRGRRRWSRAEARSARPWSAASWRRCPARRGRNNSAAG